MEHEELLFLANIPVVTLLGLRLEVLPLCQLLVVREGDAVHALQRLAVGRAEPIRAGVLGHFEGLHVPRVGHVRTPAQVDQRAAPVHRAALPVRHLGGNDLHLEGVVFEHFQRLLLWHEQALKRLLLGHNLAHQRVDLVVVVFRDLQVILEQVVVEALGQRGADAQVGAPAPLDGLPQQVRRRVPEHLLALGRVKLAQRERAVRLQGAVHVPHDVIHLGGNARIGKPLGDARSHLVRCGLERHAIQHLPVGQRDLDGSLGALLALSLLLQRFEHLHAV
mmetsp:Transcript_15283/g.38921  ORF Transcript_15283/g.38921 Transcript_15283/m.38921 type:complete len:278 (-) Transcript_15283:291-1124(-)